MRILLTGATGLIGASLGEKLFLAGHSLVAVSRTPESAPVKCPFPATFISWKEMPSELAHVDAVIHLAGAPIAQPWFAKHKANMISSRCDTALQLCTHIKKHPHIKVYLQASALGYYPESHDYALEESLDPHKDFAGKLCDLWEKPAKTWLAEGSTRYVIFRLGHVIKAQHGLLEAFASLLPFYLPPLISKGSCNWIHLEDVVGAFEQALTNESLSGAVNLTAPEACSLKHFSQKLHEHYGRNYKLSLPSSVLKFCFGEMSQVLLKEQKVSLEKLKAHYKEFKYPNLKAALDEEMPFYRKNTLRLRESLWLPHKAEEAAEKVLSPSFFMIFGNNSNFPKDMMEDCYMKPFHLKGFPPMAIQMKGRQAFEARQKEPSLWTKSCSLKVNFKDSLKGGHVHIELSLESPLPLLHKRKLKKLMRSIKQSLKQLYYDPFINEALPR